MKCISGIKPVLNPYPDLKTCFSTELYWTLYAATTPCINDQNCYSLRTQDILEALLITPINTPLFIITTNYLSDYNNTQAISQILKTAIARKNQVNI